MFRETTPVVVLKHSFKKKKKKKRPVRGELANVKSRQLPANKTDELFEEKKKKNFASRELLFRVQTKQTVVHNNEPARDIRTNTA